ncbi:hypothetical protein ACRRTK_024882 [Alexandromys fortis]
MEDAPFPLAALYHVITNEFQKKEIWMPTRASWTVTEKAWDKTGLSDHGEQ